MPQDSRYKLVCVALLVVLANGLDMLSTYAASPDLAAEWNVLQRQFGLGWSGLLSAKAVGIGLAIAGYAYYLRTRDRCYPSPGLSMGDFARHLTFGPSRTVGAPSVLLRHLGVNLGYFWAGMQVLVVWVALDNMLLRHGLVWGIRSVSEMGYHMLQSMVVAAFVTAQFYRVNYRRYLGPARRVPVRPS